jgi:hypothetical protein
VGRAERLGAWAATIGAGALAALGGGAAWTGHAAAAPAPGVHVAAFRVAAGQALGERTPLTGRVAPARRVRVVVQALEPAGRWRALATLRADRHGRFRADLPLARSRVLRAAVRGPDGVLRPGPVRSAAVRRDATLSVTPGPLEAIAGRPLAVRGAIRPGRAGERVVIQGSRGGAFRALAALRTRAGGRFAGTVSPPAGGRWRFRAVAPAIRGRLLPGGAVTGPLALFGRNPHGVPASAPRYLVQVIHETRLYYYERGRLRRVFPVVFGKPSTPTPVGRFAVYGKGPGPSPAFGPLVLWYHGGYGIHGTNQEYLLTRSWRYYSHGCTRNWNVNIRWLWPRVAVGTPVRSIA